MKFILEIDMNNAAFEEPYQFMELRRILEETAERVDIPNGVVTMEKVVLDVNGNTVGSWKVVPS